MGLVLVMVRLLSRLFSLTEAGAALTGPAQQVRQEVADRLTLSPDEVDTLRTLGQGLIDSYEPGNDA